MPRYLRYQSLLASLPQRVLAAWLCALPTLVSAAVPIWSVHATGEPAAAANPALSWPADVAVGREDRLYICDSGNQRVVIVAATGNRLAIAGGAGAGDAELRDPVGLGVAPDGTLYVADRGRHRLVAFGPDGAFLRAIPLEYVGAPVSPVDVAAATDGRELYVTASNLHRVLVLDSGGRLLRSWGGFGEGDGQFRFPATLAIGADGSVYVVDVLNTRVQVFDRDGTLLRKFGKPGVLPGSLFRPKGIAIDRGGRVLVSDSYVGVVQAFSAEGNFLAVLGDQDGPHRFITPTGLALDSAGRLVVSEMQPGKVIVHELGALP